MSAFPPNTTALDACVDMTPAHGKLAALGFDTILRYGAAAPWKCITPKEAQSMQSHELKLALIYETTVRDITLGASEGARAGVHAAKFAPTVGLSAGTGAAIYATADFDIQHGQLSAALAYLSAFAQACQGYELGLYANGLLTDTAFTAKLVKFRWITQSMGFTGTREALEAGRFELAQRLPARVEGLDVDPDSLREPGLDIGARVPWGTSQEAPVVQAVSPALPGKPVVPTASESALRRILDILQELVTDAQNGGSK